MVNTPFVSVIVPVFNGADSITETVKSLFRQTYPKDQYEIIVVDDGSKDTTAEAVQPLISNSDRRLYYFFQQNSGPASARNLGLGRSRGQIIAFIDSDCVACESWIAEMAGAFEEDQLLAGVGGRVESRPAASPVSQYCAWIRLNETPLMDNKGIYCLISANAAFRRSAICAAGGFNESFIMPGGEDLDLCIRLKKLGYFFQYNMRAVVYTRHKATAAELFKTSHNYGKGGYLCLNTSGSPQRRRYNFAQITGATLIWMLKQIKAAANIIAVLFKGAHYYGQGLGIRRALLYGLLDYGRYLAYNQGFLAQCLMDYYKNGNGKNNKK